MTTNRQKILRLLQRQIVQISPLLKNARVTTNLYNFEILIKCCIFAYLLVTRQISQMSSIGAVCLLQSVPQKPLLKNDGLPEVFKK